MHYFKLTIFFLSIILAQFVRAEENLEIAKDEVIQSTLESEIEQTELIVDEEGVKSVNNEIKDLKKTQSKLNGQLKGTIIKREKSLTELERLNEKLISENEKIKTLQSAIKQEKTKQYSVQKENVVLKYKLGKTEIQIEKQEKSISDLKNAIRQIQNENKNLQKKHKQALKSQDKNDNKIFRLKKQFQKLKSMNKDLKTHRKIAGS